MMENELPEVNGVNVIHVSQDFEPQEIKEFMDNWIDQNPDITSDPGQIVIFSPYDMKYSLENIDGINHLTLTGYMSRTKWATLADADDLRSFAFQLQKNHANLIVKVDLALSVKAFEEDDESYNFVRAYFEKNQEVHDMIIKMNLEQHAAEKNLNSNEENSEDETELEEDLDSELFGKN